VADEHGCFRRKPHPIVKDLVLDSVAKLALDLSP
jgi:hypothetical protein